ncbi:MAG: hypothetical protein Q9162_003958 [Coniocarpon cinnabarinum]
MAASPNTSQQSYGPSGTPASGLNHPPHKYELAQDEENGTNHAPLASRSASYKQESKRKRNPNYASVSGDGRGIDLDGFDMMDTSASEDAQDVVPPDTPTPPVNFPLSRYGTALDERLKEERRASALVTPQMRSQRLIGNSNPRYRWEQYYTGEEELGKMKQSVRKYYERNNYLIVQYLYIDRLLDSSLPHNLLQEYGENQTRSQQLPVDVPQTISEESSAPSTSHTPFEDPSISSSSLNSVPAPHSQASRPKRTKSLYKLSTDESTPLLLNSENSQKEPNGADVAAENVPEAFQIEDSDSSSRVVNIAIYINFAANTILLILKVIVMLLTSSLSVLASLVDAALDFLSTAIIFTTNRLISSSSAHRLNFPVGRQRLEPLGVLIFSVVMITSFAQVAIEAFNRLIGSNHEVVVLTPAAIAIMASTVVVKGLCWFWCRLVKNSSVQALAQDAATDVVFNSFSIFFPLVGYFFSVWWLDPLGGLLLSLYVIISWSLTTRIHILNLVGRTASADERNILLYLTMRFAKCIRKIQSLAAYHVGDKLNVEVDIVLDENVIGDSEGSHAGLSAGARALRDIHDLGESLQYVLESVPGVERAFVHSDYWEGNLPSHMNG